ncbi:MAG: histidinol dehydrogenase [Candidatus Nezhaarchaeales archaeon]
MKVVKLSELGPGLLERLVRRGPEGLSSVMEEVRRIVAEVRDRGDEALRRLSRQFDGVEVEDWRLEADEEEVEGAYRAVGEGGLRAIREAIANVRRFHEATRPASSSIKVVEGLVAGRLVKPLRRVGVYVPRGRAGYPSTAIMTVVPAKVAGVEEVIVCTPPLKDGRAPPSTLVAAVEAGADRVFKVGGAHAIAAMAYGTQSIPRVEKVVGPGGLYVTAAKVAVSLDVAVDLPAGPSEIVVLADEADPALVAMDLLAQAEHGPGSMAILITTSVKLAEEVAREVEGAGAPEGLGERALAIVVEDLGRAVELVNELAPEHVELLVKDPMKALGSLRNAGAVFVGPLSAAALGDYVAGPSHVLPTGGYARAFSGLSCRDFVKEVSFVACLPQGLRAVGRAAVELARMEGFEFHALSIEERLRRLGEG